MSEKIAEDCHTALMDTSKCIVDVSLQIFLLVEAVKRSKRDDDGVQDASDLVVLVNEHEGIGDIVISKMNHTRTNPATGTPLCLAKDRMHDAGHTRGGLNTVQTLTSVAKSVKVTRVEEIIFGEEPKLEHIVENRTPQRQRLQTICVLIMVSVGQACSMATSDDGERVPCCIDNKD